MAITGAHVLLYSSQAEQLRKVLRDVLGWHHVDAGGGWLIFRLPPAEIAVHPGEAPAHELALMCDDLEATTAELRTKGWMPPSRATTSSISTTGIRSSRWCRRARQAAAWPQVRRRWVRHRALGRAALTFCRARVGLRPRPATPRRSWPGP